MTANSTNSEQRGFGVRTPLIGVAVLIVVLGGLVVDADKTDGDNFYANIIRLDNVATKIHQSYVEEVSSEALVDQAIDGMLSILDPHTSYFQEKQYEELRIHTEGEFGGLGIQIAIRDKILTVMTPISGTPASRAGIQSGDQIIEIDGESTKGITIDEAVDKLRGRPGSEVAITVRRRGEAKTLEFTITREVIKIRSVPYFGMVSDEGIGYVRLLSFSQDAGSEIERAIRDLMAGGELEGLILDLRHNPGGLLPQAIEVSEKFLPKKSLVVSTRGRERSQNKEFYASSNPVLPLDVPLVVLVSRSSASASEIVAGAIQDWDRGVVLGDTTFGKGSVQSILTLDRKHKLKLTTAFYYTPSGRCINRPENDIRGNGEDGDDEKDTVEADTTTYRTRNGRIVHGGGGIVPDTIVEPERLSASIVSLFGKGVFFKFANLEYPRLKKQGVEFGENYKIDDRTLNRFWAFLDSIDYEYHSAADAQFNEFLVHVGLKSDTSDADADVEDDSDGASAEDAERQREKARQSQMDDDDQELTEEELAQMRQAAERIREILENASERSLEQQKDEIREHLAEALLVRALGQDHEIVYRRKLAEDMQVSAAMALLRQRKSYTALLSVGSEDEGK
ncbi:MAG: PDZ domain-containing protein [Chitinivibrionales bacterium]|nr:PDZ domain-containing protein [Chitinivibrionales bacterium]